MTFIESVFAKLKRHPKRIVFPEGEEPRVLHAARKFFINGLGVPILLGKREVIEKVALAENVDLDHIGIINPETSSDLPIFCERLEKLKRYRQISASAAQEIMINRNYYAAMMLQYGLVDGLVGGVSEYSGALLRPLIQLVKPLPHAKLISSCTIIETDKKEFGDDGILIFADCGVVPEPNIEQLASIAVQAGLMARQVFGQRPRVGMLSFSTKGSATTPATERIVAATALAKKIANDIGAKMEIDGEMQADTALVAEIAKIKAPQSLVAGKANVLIFPDLNSANISAKLVHHLAGAQVYGQLLLGLSRPAAELSRGTHMEDIASVAAIVGLQAIEYRKLYPVDENSPDAN
ncbi:MAG: phosphate acyltransferase [Chthoniobacterales bacterium]